MTGIFSRATKRFLVVGSLLLVVAPLVFALVFAPAAPRLSRELCGVPDDLVSAVKPGDEVALEGTLSRFGLVVTRVSWPAPGQGPRKTQ